MADNCDKDVDNDVEDDKDNDLHCPLYAPPRPPEAKDWRTWKTVSCMLSVDAKHVVMEWYSLKQQHRN
jgi:hypothetical protein